MIRTRWIGGRHPLAKAADPDVDTLPERMVGRMTQEQYDILLYRLREGVGPSTAIDFLPCSLSFEQAAQKRLAVTTDKNAVYRLGMRRKPKPYAGIRKPKSKPSQADIELVLSRLREGLGCTAAVKGTGCTRSAARGMQQKLKEGELK